MKFLVWTVISLIMIMISQSLPKPQTPEEATTPSPIRAAVQYHMKIYLSQSEEIVKNALKHFPDTLELKESRDTLNEFMQHIELYKTRYEKCDWNLVNFNKDLRTVLNFFSNANATTEVKDMSKFLNDSGLKNVKDQCHLYLRRFLNGELGDEKDINEDYC